MREQGFGSSSHERAGSGGEVLEFLTIKVIFAKDYF
jgi:hypothetical protein